MNIPISDAKALLTDLVRRAEEGEEIVLTRYGRPVVRLAPVDTDALVTARRRAVAEIRARAAQKAAPGPGAARSQDFLYGDDGLP